MRLGFYNNTNSVTKRDDNTCQDEELAAAWRELKRHFATLQQLQLQDLFATDPDRAQRFTANACGLYLDYSKNRMTPETMERLYTLARAARLGDWIEAMFSGRQVNTSEHRPALHVALRAPEQPPFPCAQHNLMPLVHDQLRKLGQRVEQLRAGQWLGYSGEAITDLVNLGIGGSDLGPKMVSEALGTAANETVRCHFVSNLDADDLYGVLDHCDPRRTLFLVASKSFTTEETLLNAQSAKNWLLADPQAGTEAVGRHFIAISAATQRCLDFGVKPENIFELWDWVGGRYSLWSSIGFSIAVRIGMPGFHQLLAGARSMDVHFRDTPLDQNLPVLLALIGIWNRNMEGAASQVVLPYDYALRHFPEFLQQLEMESNGKSCSRDGQPLDESTTPVLWGALGNNAQHAFNQFLHQGSDRLPVDFIVPIFGRRGKPRHEKALLAHALAQAAVMLAGRDPAQLRTSLVNEGVAPDALEAMLAHRALAGNRSSNMLLYERLDAFTMGALIALYEHKVFVQGVCWQINSFDQWGVELGKQVAGDVYDAINGAQPGGQYDASTAGLIRYICHLRKELDG